MCRTFALRAGGALMLAVLLTGSPVDVLAHAVPERAIPPIDGVVATPPEVVEIWFTEEVASTGTRVEVIGPDGSIVNQGEAAVDLNDPNRQRVTVALTAGLGAGTYIVQWHSVSNIDQDEVDGSYRFTVDPNATPQPVASLTAEVPTPPPAAVPSPTPIPAAAGDYDFDGWAFGLSIGAGLVAAVLIFFFWRFVRPRPTE